MKNGFTLVELAIVLVIVGLLIGGVLAGQSLIQAAKISKIVTHLSKTDTAVKTFQLKYNAYPGDMRNAYQVFGPECGDNDVQHAAGCNGNGDKCIVTNDACPSTSGMDYNSEVRKAFVHLHLSKIMQGPHLTNSNIATTNCTIANDRFPRALDDTASIIYSPRSGLITLQLFKAGFDPTETSGTGCTFVYRDATATTGAFLPEDAMSADIKLDDGKGRSGKVIAPRNFSGGYLADCNDSNGNYNVATETTACNIRIYIQK